LSIFTRWKILIKIKIHQKMPNVDNVCYKEKYTKRSSNTLLRLVYFSVKQTLFKLLSSKNIQNVINKNSCFVKWAEWDVSNPFLTNNKYLKNSSRWYAYVYMILNSPGPNLSQKCMNAEMILQKIFHPIVQFLTRTWLWSILYNI
jgi:hypothetical protein